MTLEFLEAAKGCRRAVHLQANTSCGDCSGTGCSPGTSMSTCRACSGTGTQKIERGPIIFGTVCSRCNGSGQIVAHPCKSVFIRFLLLLIIYSERARGLELELNRRLWIWIFQQVRILTPMSSFFFNRDQKWNGIKN